MKGRNNRKEQKEGRTKGQADGRREGINA